jgi:hypothetical protein
MRARRAVCETSIAASGSPYPASDMSVGASAKIMAPRRHNNKIRWNNFTASSTFAQNTEANLACQWRLPYKL